MDTRMKCNGYEFDVTTIIHRERDGSLVVSVLLDDEWCPFCVTKDMSEYADLYAAVLRRTEQCPECVTEEPPYVAYVPTVEDLAASIRAERDKRIAATDYLVMPDYPISQENLEEIKVYRQALRDIPQQQGFPWNGPDDPECTWPSLKH